MKIVLDIDRDEAQELCASLAASFSAELSLNIREALLGERHPKTRELRQALGLAGDTGFQQGFDHEPAAPPEIRPAFRTARGATAEEMKNLQRRLVKLAHPDQAQGGDEFELRNRMMIEINEAVKAADGGRLVKLASSVRSELKRRGWLRGA